MSGHLNMYVDESCYVKLKKQSFLRLKCLIFSNPNKSLLFWSKEVSPFVGMLLQQMAICLYDRVWSSDLFGCKVEGLVETKAGISFLASVC